MYTKAHTFFINFLLLHCIYIIHNVPPAKFTNNSIIALQSKCFGVRVGVRVAY